MNCEQVALRIDAHLDGEMAGDESRRLTEHIRECPRCTARFAHLLELTQALAGLPDIAAPPELAPQVQHELAAREARDSGMAIPARSARQVGWALGATGALATAGIAAAVMSIAWFCAEWWEPVCAVARALAGPVVATSIRLLDTATAVTSACSPLVVYGLLTDFALLAACVMVVLACRYRPAAAPNLMAL